MMGRRQARRKRITSFCSLFLAFVMTVSMLVPGLANAADSQEGSAAQPPVSLEQRGDTNSVADGSNQILQADISEEENIPKKEGLPTGSSGDREPSEEPPSSTETPGDRNLPKDRELLEGLSEDAKPSGQPQALADEPMGQDLPSEGAAEPTLDVVLMEENEQGQLEEITISPEKGIFLTEDLKGPSDKTENKKYRFRIKLDDNFQLTTSIYGNRDLWAWLYRVPDRAKLDNHVYNYVNKYWYEYQVEGSGDGNQYDFYIPVNKAGTVWFDVQAQYYKDEKKDLTEAIVVRKFIGPFHIVPAQAPSSCQIHGTAGERGL